MAYYQRLRHLREDKDLTLKDIAKILNTSYQYYQKYEKGLKDLPLERAIILADFYNVSIDYLAGRTNDKRGIGYADSFKAKIEQNNNEIAIVENKGNVTINNLKK